MKRHGWMSGPAAALGLMFLLWGCGSHDGNPMTDPPNDASQEDVEDIADDYSTALASSDEGMLGMWSDAGYDQPGPMVQENRDRNSALDDTIRFEFNGFQVSLIRSFFDAQGNWSAIYDPLTSVRMERWLTINGSHTNQSGRRSVTLDHADHLSIVGIQLTDDNYVLDGDGHRLVQSEFSSRFHQNVKTLTADYAWTVNALVIAHDRRAHPYPLSGNIAVNVTITRTHTNPGHDEEVTRHASFVVYFDGTRYAVMVFADGTRFWIDLSNGDCGHDHP